MRTQSNTGLIRLGILVLALSGLLLLVWHIGILSEPDSDVDPAGAARAVTSASYFPVMFVGGVLGIVALIFGFFALSSYLANTRARLLATLGMILGITGVSLQMTQTGIIVFALPVVGKAYLAGQHSAIDIANGFFQGPAAGLMLLLILLLYSAGTILFGIAIWRSETLPKWSGVLFAVHGPLMAGPVPETLLFVGSALLLVSSIWIALSILPRPAPEIRTETQPRVA